MRASVVDPNDHFWSKPLSAALDSQTDSKKIASGIDDFFGTPSYLVSKDPNRREVNLQENQQSGTDRAIFI